jgi:prepilin peptidase CpaA
VLPGLLSVVGISCLVAAAVFDVRERRIPNACCLGLALAGLLRLFLAVFLSENGPVGPILGDLALTLAVFLAGAGLFAAGALGGGDVKLLAAACLWLGGAHVPEFLLATALAGGVLATAKLAERRLSATEPRIAGLPYGLAIAAGGLAAAPGFLFA